MPWRGMGCCLSKAALSRITTSLTNYLLLSYNHYHVVFRFLAHVSSYTETPAVACVVSGFLAALLSLLVSLRDLIEMMSIGTLLAYTLVRLQFFFFIKL